MTNPPYGVRLQKQNINSWKALAEWLRSKAMGSKACIITPDASKGFMLGIREQRSWQFLNGDIEIQLRSFNIEKSDLLKVLEGQHFVLPAQAQMLANRLKKKRDQLAAWAKENKLDAWRIYDADLPEYAVAIDIYKDQIHLQEYKAPSTIKEKKAQLHLQQCMLAVQSVLQPDPARIYLKTRQKQKGKDQYSKQKEAKRFLIREGTRQYLVDLESYLDTGLFLDHRWLRNTVQQIAGGKKVLNLFCYTGSISVAAAVGGAQLVDSVDTSKTYLAWAKRKFSCEWSSTQFHAVTAL